jgi:hypothetical protein
MDVGIQQFQVLVVNSVELADAQESAAQVHYNIFPDQFVNHETNPRRLSQETANGGKLFPPCVSMILHYVRAKVLAEFCQAA